MCRLLEVSRSGFYAWLSRDESARSLEDRALTTRIKAIYKESRCTYGAPRIHAALKNADVRCGLNRVARLMDLAGLRAHVRRRRWVKTTDSNHSYAIAPNLLQDRRLPEAIDRVWVADITYISTDEGWLYLATVMDLCSRKIVGWSMQDNMKTGLTLAALTMALEHRDPSVGLIHHSDRGSQYAAHDYKDVLNKHGVRASMSRKGNCYDNAAQESFFHSLKTELVYREHYRTRDEARASVFDYIEAFYNRERLHSSLGYCSPDQFEARAA